MNEIKISARRSTTMSGVQRRAREEDYNCIFVQDGDTGLYFGYINSDYNIGSLSPIIYKHIRAFNPTNPEESLRGILKEIDNEMVARDYISRCVVIVFKSPNKTLVAKVGGGIFPYAVCPAPDPDLPSAVYLVCERSWESERDFFCGSGSVVPVIEHVDSDSRLSIMTQTMKTDIEKGFDGKIEDIITSNLDGVISPTKVSNFMDDVFDLIYRGSPIGAADAYLLFI